MRKVVHYMKETLKMMQRGQVLLITLLVLAFAVTVTLSLIARTTSDVSITNQMEDSAKAFSAAEAGIEEGLRATQSSTLSKVLSGGSQFTMNVVSVGGAAGTLTLPRSTSKGTTETIWLVNHKADGSLDETRVFSSAFVDLCWTKPTTTVPAVAVSVLYKRGTSYYVAKGAYDSEAGRAAINQFSSPTSQNPKTECGSADYRARLTFASFGIDPAADTLLMLRIRPVYADTILSLDSSAVIPFQGKQVESTGTSGAGATRKIVVFQQYHSADSLFDAALYSQANLVK